MKKYLFSLVFAFSALVMLNGCIVSEQKLTDKIQAAIVDDEQSKGKTLLKGKLDGKEVVYDVKVTDEGDDFDVDWTLRP